jgi:hypothetical protein
MTCADCGVEREWHELRLSYSGGLGYQRPLCDTCHERDREAVEAEQRRPRCEFPVYGSRVQHVSPGDRRGHWRRTGYVTGTCGQPAVTRLQVMQGQPPTAMNLCAGCAAAVRSSSQRARTEVIEMAVREVEHEGVAVG